MQTLPRIPDKYRHLRLPPTRRVYEYLLFVPFVSLHLVCFGLLWTGVQPIDWAVFAVLYVTRVFGVMAGYHRYFSHRSFKTGRVFQFLLAFLAESTLQKGVLWWAAHHRTHHKYTDLPWDVHSPGVSGFWHSHMMWLAEVDSECTRDDRVRDLMRFPELRWISKNWMIPPTLLAAAVWHLYGWSGLLLGFFGSTVLLLHVTFFVNSVAHVYGTRRFDTPDTSHNSWLLSLLTLGEGWHNNHHYYQTSARQGFYWWEFDIHYYILRALSWFGIVWDLRPIPEAVLAEGRARDAAARARKG